MISTRRRAALRAAPASWRAELLYVAVAAMESLCWTPWVLLLAPGIESLHTVQIMLFTAINLFGALLLVRATAAKAWGPAAFVIGLAAALFVTLRYALPIETLSARLPMFAVGTLFFPPVALTVALVLLLWYRGSQVGTLTITPTRASFELRVGIVALVAAALLPNARLQHTVLLLLPLFFFCGLLASSMARSASLRTNRETQHTTFGLGWIGFTGLIGVALSAVGFVFALLLAGFPVDSILELLVKLLSAVAFLVFTLLTPLVNLVIWLINSVLALFSLHQIQLDLATENPLDALYKMLSDASSQTPLAARLLAYAPLICLTGALTIIVIIMLIRLRNRARVTLRDGEERESLDSDAIRNSLRATLQRGLDRLSEALGSLTQFGSGAPTAYSIRRLYVRLVAQASQQGYPRGAAQTPLEYQPTLIAAFPAFEREIKLLTGAYIDVHYGELPDDPGLVAAARTAITRIEASKAVPTNSPPAPP